MSRYRIAHILLLGCALLAAPAIAEVDLWIGDSQGLKRIDASTRKTSPLVTVRGIQQIAPDGSGGVWVLDGAALRAYDSTGRLRASASLKTLGLNGDKYRIRVDPRDATLWMADEYRLLHIDTQLRARANRLFSEPILDFAVLPDQSVWVLCERFLWHFAPQATDLELLETVDIATLQLADVPNRILHDPVRNRVWIVAAKSLHKFQLPDFSVRKSFALTQAGRDFVFDPGKERLWVLSADNLSGYSGGGAAPESIDLHLYGVRDPKTLAYESSTGDLWLQDARGVSSLNLQTRQMIDIPKTQSTVALQAAPLNLLPAVSLVQPPAESRIATQNETFVLRLDGRCYRSVCAPASYAKRFALDAALGTENIGAEFKLDPVTGLSSYTAPHLPEGKLSFNAFAADTYGQESNRIATHFIAAKRPPSVELDANGTQSSDAVLAAEKGDAVTRSSADPPEVSFGHSPDGGLSPEERAQKNFLRLPLQFTINQGQFDSDVKFMSRGPGYSLSLGADRTTLNLRRGKRRDDPKSFGDTQADAAKAASVDRPLHMRFIGANAAAKVSGLDELPGHSNFFRGNKPQEWRRNVPNFARVKYENVYPGIDRIYHGDQNQLEYDWMVEPGANAALIRQIFEGADTLSVDANGDLLVTTAGGTIRQKKPFAYQEQNGVRIEVPAEYRLVENGEVHFRLGDYDKTRPLVIDPVLYGYTMQIGSMQSDMVAGLKLDKDGNAYLANTTSSYGSWEDIEVYKINAAGNTVLFTAVIGGSGRDEASGLAVNAAGDVYVAGTSDSTDFPNVSAVQPFSGGKQDAVVARIYAEGNELFFSTYYGGAGDDYASAIALDNNGAPYIAGYTNSSNFPRRSKVATSYGGGIDGFIVKLTAGGARVYGGYVGGGGEDVLKAIAVDPAGFVHVAGWSASSDLQYNSPYAFGGNVDAFFGKLDIVQGTWVYRGYLGGSGEDGAYGMDVDNAGDVYIVGKTASSNFPVVQAYQPYMAGESDGFVSKLNAAGTLAYSTYLGGENVDAIGSIAVDAQRQAHVAGISLSESFPGIHMERHPGDEAVIAKLNVAGNALVYAGSLPYIGNGDAVAVDKKGNAYIAGVASEAAGYTIQGQNDVFLFKLLPPDEKITLTSLRNPSAAGGPVTFIATVAGDKPSGPVTFKEGNSTLGIVTLSGGVASLTTTALGQGTHSITARYSGDAKNAAQTSGALNQIVTAPGVATVTISNPVANSNQVFGSPLAYTVSVALSPGRILRSVIAQIDGIDLPGIIDPPALTVSGSYLDLGLGTHQISARAIDNTGMTGVSAITSFNVIMGPTVTLTTPKADENFTAPAGIVLTANAVSNVVGQTISKVDFFQGSTLIGTSNTPPYRAAWPNVPVGQYILTAVATDSAGTIGTSQPVSISVTPFGAPKTTYLHTDFAGSPVAATDATGALIWKEAYRPFGVKQKSEAASKDQDQWFHGKEQDKGTGLQYFGARYYDPVVGRFMGVDPKGVDPTNIHTFNRYAYGNNNPYKYLDPNGAYTTLIMTGLRVTITVTGISETALGISIVGGGIATRSSIRNNPESAAGIKATETAYRKFLGIDKMFSESSEEGGDAASGETGANVSPGTSNPMEGEPGSKSTSNNSKGNKNQDRTYGPDGWPKTDIDYDHNHKGADGEKVGQPHAHDWGRPEGGGRPTDADRSPARPLRPGEGS